MTTLADVEKKLKEAYGTLEAISQERQRYTEDNRIFFFHRPNPIQAKLLEAWKNPEKKVFTLTGANRIGKTTIGTIIGFSTLFGFWPWDSKPMTFIHKRPRKVRYVGQGWETHIKTVVLPALEYWWPKSRKVSKKKNNQGIDYWWVDEQTGSSLEVMSNMQESDVFEGWEGDLIVYDEPPRRDIRVACARGMVDRCGRELFVATLIKEAWLHREVIKALDSNGLPDKTYFHVEADIGVNVGYGLTQEGVTQFAKSLRDDEKQARLAGKPSYLSALVCPQFSREVHLKDRFDIPLSWLIDISIDYHPAKPWAIAFLGTAPNGFKWICGEIKEHGTPEEIGDRIVKWFRTKGLARVHRCVIDPLAKGDSNNDFTIYDRLANKLSAYGISLELATKDKEGGITILNSLLWTENKMPALLFFRDCTHSIQGIEDWLYETTDSGTIKPSKENDDFCECIYRLCLLNTTWFEPDLINAQDHMTTLI
jgi:hypothetical protein